MSNAGTKHINELIRTAGARKQAAPEYDPGAVATKRLDLSERLGELDESALAEVDNVLTKIERRTAQKGVSDQVRTILDRKRRKA